VKLSVCIDSVFRELGLEDSLRKVKEEGFRAFEFWGWEKKDLGLMTKLVQELDLSLSAFCVKQANLTEPSARSAYLDGLKETLEVAKRLQCRTLILTVGSERAGVPREEQRRSLVEGLRASLPLLEGTGVTLAVEPLNTLIDHPGYFLSYSQEAWDILQEVRHPQVQMLFDIYHQQITEGQVTTNLLRMLERVGHIHSAGNPGRGELGEGELNYPYIFRRLTEAGYKGYVGLEYFTAGDPVESLQRMAAAYSEWL
jgi:hydroxypyruvate isomerase